MNVMVRELSLGERMKMELIARSFMSRVCYFLMSLQSVWTWLAKNESRIFAHLQ
jgi:ABC-type uncharacterized transport system, ATPase component